MKFYKKLKNLVFPPRCGACMRLLDYDSDEVLCEDCKERFQQAEHEVCPKCGEFMLYCRCMPKHMADAECTALVRLARYRASDVDGVINSLINNIKRYNTREVFDFLSDELRPTLSRMMRNGLIPEDGVIVTFCPRGRRSRRENGFDQAEMLARRIAVADGCVFARLFERRRTVRQKKQKSLRYREREKNAGSTIILRRDIDVRDSVVVLVDDVVTTGATMSVCCRLLREAGASAVLCFCVATA